MEHKILKTEGDVNISEERIKWQEKNNSSSEIRNLLRKDSELFLHQAMSTPCLDVLQKCDAATIENLDGKQYLDFHGNNVHQIGFSNSYLTDKIKTQYTWLLSGLGFTATTLSGLFAGELLKSNLTREKVYRPEIG